MAHWSKVTYSALSKWDALNFIEVVDFSPDLVETDKLYYDLFGLLNSFQVSLGIVLYFVYFFCDGLFDFGIFVTLGLVFEFLLDFFKVVEDIFSVMQFFCFEVSFEECSLQSIPKFYFFVLDHWALALRALEVFEVIDSPVMFASPEILPFYPNPQLLLIDIRSIVQQRPEVSDYSCAVIE